MLELGQRLVRGAVVQVDAPAPVADVGRELVVAAVLGQRERQVEVVVRGAGVPAVEARPRGQVVQVGDRGEQPRPHFAGGRVQELVPAVDPDEHGVAAHPAARRVVDRAQRPRLRLQLLDLGRPGAVGPGPADGELGIGHGDVSWQHQSWP
ncbi:hypothetical protein ACIRSS_40865 [Amycolatopsis sp. NPDC101161]|uniref:hypothetical protein n=1 Tax=Amycolatopsis sp. NPDC101161 TaxID=3363940 RepID=UPI003814D9D6